MNKIILSTILLLSLPTAVQQKEKTAGMVYICTGSNAKKYHCDVDCRGLNNCQGSIRQISLQKAREMGRTACKICY